MIVWVNGTFGVGKTTTANAVAERTNWRMFDPEHVGYLLAGNLSDLDCDETELRRRIENDGIERQALEWRLDHLARFQHARPWLTQSADLFLDTTDLTSDAAAKAIIAAVQ